MIARHEGQIVLLAAAIPGERVRARVERVSKGVIYATTVDVLRASDDRRRVDGDWTCGGAVYAHIAYARQLEIKSAVISDAFARIAHLTITGVPVTGSEERGYRMRARLHVRNSRIGFYREGTHDLCNPRETGQLLPQTLDAVEALGRALYGARITGVASLELSENMPADQRAVHLEIDRPTNLLPVADALGADLTGLSYSGPFARMSATVAGTPLVTDRVVVVTADGEHPMELQHDVRAFFQANRYLLPTLVSRVVSLVDPGPVVDLYAGVGLFGVALAACGRSGIAAVEGDRASGGDLVANVAPYGAAIEAVREPVETFLARRPAPPGATFVVDPPRTGMSREALDAIVASCPPAILYVSCDVATLARDVRRLMNASYEVDHIQAFDLFPNTAHVETVVRLRRTPSATKRSGA